MVASTNNLNRILEIEKCMDAITHITYLKDVISENVFNQIINTNKAKLILLGTTYEQELSNRFVIKDQDGVNVIKVNHTGLFIKSS
jgi:hypothetical protein